MSTSIMTSSSPKDVFPSGRPQNHIFCMHCSKWFMLCQCAGLGHGEGMYFALPAVPESMTVKQRLDRWAFLVMFHPLFQCFNAKLFLADQGPSFVNELAQAQPITTRLMEEYKKSKDFEEGPPMNLMDEDGREQVRRDCDLAIQNFFQGNWGQIKFFEWIMLNNAIQCTSKPEDFTGNDHAVMEKVIKAIVTMMSIHENLCPGSKNLNFQMEDIL